MSWTAGSFYLEVSVRSYPRQNFAKEAKILSWYSAATPRCHSDIQHQKGGIGGSCKILCRKVDFFFHFPAYKTKYAGLCCVLVLYDLVPFTTPVALLRHVLFWGKVFLSFLLFLQRQKNLKQRLPQIIFLILFLNLVNLAKWEDKIEAVEHVAK